MTIRNIHKVGLSVGIIILALTGCNKAKQEETLMSITTEISPAQWQVLEKKRVIFGHQSVGENILSGVTHLAARDGVKLAINKQRTAPTENGITHFNIGENGNPKSKIQDFAAAIDAGAAQGADVAMMKLCYVDFNTDTDAKQLANDYMTSLDLLAQKHPHTRFVAITAPLMAIQTGPKAWVKKLLGRHPSGYEDNAKRGEFNTLLRQHYLADNRLFDLAKFETEATGSTCTAEVNGQKVDVLCPEITNDGGHLNERGQVLLGAELVKFISSLPTKQVTK